ncbi:hypothetical protein HMPREF0080_01322 [Anaeroglobus geminatus F0357]|uniref:Transposase IS200-like domain-containing protein n=1 Tax=Anaeroglobus geminatus F0357 TaxID=861450 RepID=G9YI37_9FIRM|nr:hypothetical protein HMPREF0080_01322 [Anaeroglobus geminatus F0357]
MKLNILAPGRRADYKGSLMIYETWGNRKYTYRNHRFWCSGYYVDMVEKDRHVYS